MHKLSTNRINFSLLIPAILLTFMGLMIFYSIDRAIFQQQLTFLVLGVLIYIVFLNIDYKIFSIFSKQIYIAMILLLLAIFIIGIEAKGAVRWIEIFGLRVQFSEVFKPFFVVVMASFITKTANYKFANFIKYLIILVPIFFLILSQPDLGNAAIYVLFTVFMLFMYGFSLTYFIAIFASFLLLAPFIFNFLHDYQKQRILTFFNFGHDPLGSSYNLVQALISVGSGELFGKGFGQATQSILRFLPERHTDFVFAAISESLGFIGSSIVIILYLFLLYKIYKIGINLQDILAKLVIFGFFFLFLSHIFLNIGMNIGIVPIVGITLPFLSYGGSSLISNFIILGIISSIDFENRKRSSVEIA